MVEMNKSEKEAGKVEKDDEAESSSKKKINAKAGSAVDKVKAVKGTSKVEKGEEEEPTGARKHLRPRPNQPKEKMKQPVWTTRKLLTIPAKKKAPTGSSVGPSDCAVSCHGRSERKSEMHTERVQCIVVS